MVSMYFKKCKYLRVLNISRDERQALVNRVVALVEDHQYRDVKELINVFFNFTISGIYIDSLVGAIHEEIKGDFNMLLPFQISMIVQPLANLNNISFRARNLIYEILDNYDGFFTEFTLDDRANLFKNIAKLEMHSKLPRFQNPSILNSFKDDIQANLGSMKEWSILNIVESYIYLPWNFGRPLLEEIDQMVLMTLEHNSENIVPSFIIRYLNLKVQIYQATQYFIFRKLIF